MKPAVQPSPADVREELNAICAHKRFVRSGRLCQFLRFVVEQKLLGNRVNEQLIGVNVFGRRAGYDSGNDTIVRTEAVDLRRRLEDYYGDKPRARVRISVIKGSYNPTFTWVDESDGNEPASNAVLFPEIAEPAAQISGKQAIIPAESLPVTGQKRFVPRLGIVVSAGFLLAGIVVVGLFLWRSRPSTRLTEQDTIVLADFVNTTGESVFDGTLKQALATQLKQSPFVNVLSDAKVAATLKFMNQPTNERLTQQIAREVCQRTNSKVLLAGSIGSAGTGYVIRLRALNCQPGDTLASAESQARNRDAVIDELQAIANQLRRKLGESLPSIAKFNKPLSLATTSSLEALKAFSDGFRLTRDTGDVEAIPYYKRAIDLDPNFAEAYANLGTIYRNLNQTSLVQVNFRKAFELRDRVSERERFFIEGLYYGTVTGELENAIQTYTQWAQTYPAADTPHIDLGAYYGALGQYEKAAAQTREALRRTPREVTSYGNLMACYISLNRLDEAKATYEQAQAQKLDTSFLRQTKYLAAFLQGDEAVMRAQIAWAMGKPGVEDIFLSAQSDTEAFQGRLGKARELSTQAADSAKRNDAKETAAIYYVNAALREVEFGNAASARQNARAALNLSTGRDVRLIVALALARTSGFAEPRKILDEFNQQFPLDTMLQHYWLPTIQAALELDRGNAHRAIEVLHTTSEYDLGTPFQFPIGTMYPVYVRGLAYLKAKQPQPAATQFRNILEHRGITENFPLGALAHVQLARALVMSGDVGGGRKEYQDFFSLWKDADPDIPILKEAKNEYAKLRSAAQN